MLCLENRSERSCDIRVRDFSRTTGNAGAPSARAAASTWRATWSPPARNTRSIRTVSTVRDAGNLCWVKGPRCLSFKASCADRSFTFSASDPLPPKHENSTNETINDKPTSPKCHRRQGVSSFNQRESTVAKGLDAPGSEERVAATNGFFHRLLMGPAELAYRRTC